jgi:hypothetical protein
MANRKPEDHREKELRAAKRQAAEKLVAHKGKATWGEKLLPLGEFRRATETAGRRLEDAAREQAREDFLNTEADATPMEGPYSRVVVFGGIYNNHLALSALLEESRRLGAEAIYCLGDFGGFGPSPERVFPLLQDGGVLCSQGNYEQSLASGREDCNCGYTDPRDNHFAELSYRYTEEGCSEAFKRWMGELPERRRISIGGRQLLLVHGSPRRVNEFLFESSTPVPFLEVLMDQERADGILCTHTGMQWHRRLPSGRDMVNVGVIGRPANDGKTNVWFCLLTVQEGDLKVELKPLAYDHQGLAAEMQAEGLPEQFIETILTGWWTTCLEILPSRERSASQS